MFRALALSQSKAKSNGLHSHWQNYKNITPMHFTDEAVTVHRQHGLTCTEGTYVSRSLVEEELLSFCKCYTMADKRTKKIRYNHDCIS